MRQTIRLTMAQAVIHYLKNQMTIIDGQKIPIFAGVWAIFGHGNVAGIGEALYQARDQLPTLRAHNEQSMAHAAIAFAKASFRQRFMACTASIGPGALNMITAAGVAHTNRLPVLFLPGDVFASRIPDPVLQQVENFGDGTVSANDAFRPVTRYFDRITRPEQIIPALHRAMRVLTDAADCGPVCLSLCQDVQAEAYDYPQDFFEETIWTTRCPRADEGEIAAAIAAIKASSSPLIIAGGGVLYAKATAELKKFVERHAIPVTFTNSGKSALPDTHPLAMGAIGVTGTSAANAMAQASDLVLAVGTRLQDFTTGSWALFANENVKFIGLNISSFDASKHGALTVVGDARESLKALSSGLGDWSAPMAHGQKAMGEKSRWMEAADRAMATTTAALPSDAQIIGAVSRTMGGDNCVVVGAAGGLPGELHKLWPATTPGSYHMEYGFSCMGYEIAGGLGVKLARPQSDVVVMLGDGSYMMMNCELATSIQLGAKIIVVLLDNGGYGCINRLQMATGGANFNNLLKDSFHKILPKIDFRAHAESMGANAVKVGSIAQLETALLAAKANDHTSVIVIDTDPLMTTVEGGAWWDVAVPEVSPRSEVNKARAAYIIQQEKQR